MSQVNYLSELSGRILETSLDGFFLLDANGVISRANSAYCKMIGYLEQELVGMSITSLEADMTAKEVEMKIESVIKNGSARFETRQKGKNGSIIEIEVSTQLCEIGSDRFFPVFVRDITGHKLAISELHKKQERLSLGEEIANLGYFDRDIKTETHYWSDHAYRILGYEPQEFEGSIEKFMTFVHPDDKERLIRVAGEIVDQRDTKKSDFRIIRKDGIV
ncbi:MAG: PAS domain S-box protein, partial [Anaerohalosphaera sp.]|nr:PAS domain S-box protein [Anaerohalosphaera sp.]